MRIIFAACAAALFAATSYAANDARAVDLPKRKPGLWEIAVHMATADSAPRVMKFCTDAATDAELYKLGMSAGEGMCSKRDIQRAGNVVTTQSICQMGEMKVTSRAVMTFTGDSAYQTKIQSHFEPPMMGRGDSSMTQDAKWTGPCPADMQPGDMVAPNGMKMNVKSRAQ